MAYCVNCGVKLASSEAECPLCRTPVINPNTSFDSSLSVQRPCKIETLPSLKINWRYLYKLIALILLLSALATLLCDFLVNGQISWSLYVIGSVVIIACPLSFFYFKAPYIPITICSIGIALFVMLFSWFSSGLHWYLYLALPFIMLVCLYLLLCTLLLRKWNKNTLRTIIVCSIFCIFALLSIECLIDLYLYNKIVLSWSLYVAFPIIIICVILGVISISPQLRDEIRKRIFI